MKANGGLNSVGKDRKRKITSEQGDEQDRTKVPQSASRRHREKINQTLEELGDLLPLSEDSRSKLDKLTVLKLSVSFFQTQNYLQSGKRKRRADDAAVAEITKKLQACNINVSDISLEVLDSFFLVLSDSGDVFFASENVFKYLGYTQSFLMHQNFLNFVHHEDELGFKRCLRQATKARIIELDDGLSLDCEEMEERPIPQVCFCSIRCHAGRQSSHVSPFYYRSFKFDGNIKPLLNGKMKQYGYFALCTPVNPANPFTSTPKELLQMYSCKLGMDLGVRKLDIRGQKCLYFNEKDIMSRTGYFFVHPDDAPVMMLGHQRVTTEGHCEIVFRLMNGRGAWQWVRGKARLLYDKNDKPEDLATDNVLLNKEQGHYFQSIAYETLREWKSRQKGLPSPKTNDEKFSKENIPDSALPSSASSDNISTAGQGFSSPSEDGMSQESKDIEIIEYSSPPISAAEKKEHVLPSLGLTAGTSESCMFSSANQNRSPVEEKPNILPHDGMALNFKAERRNGDATCVNPKPNHSAHAQINLIKQFLMGEDNQPPLSSCQLESTVRVDGGVIRDSPSPWSEYPVDASSVLSELDFEQDDRLSTPCLPCPPQNGMQPSFYVNGYDHAQGKLQGQSNGLQFGGPQQGDSSNLIYPFLPDMSNPAPSSVSNPFANGAHQQQDICDVHVQAGVDDLHKMLQNGTDLLPPYLRQEGTVIHSLQQRFNQPKKEVHFSPVIQPPTENRSACDFMGHARATQPPVQDSGLWFGSSNTVPLNHNLQVPQMEEILSVDDLTPSLFVDPMVPYGNPENFHNGNPEIFHNGHPENIHNGHPENFHNGHPSESMYSASVYPTREMYMNQSMGQSFQTPQNKQQQKRVDESGNQSFQPGSKNSLLKMMLTL